MTQKLNNSTHGAHYKQFRSAKERFGRLPIYTRALFLYDASAIAACRFDTFSFWRRSKWDRQSDGSCAWCGERNGTAMHLFLRCSHFRSKRSRMRDALRDLRLGVSDHDLRRLLADPIKGKDTKHNAGLTYVVKFASSIREAVDDRFKHVD